MKRWRRLSSCCIEADTAARNGRASRNELRVDIGQTEAYDSDVNVGLSSSMEVEMDSDTRARLRAIATDRPDESAEELNYAVQVIRRVYPDLTIIELRNGAYQGRILLPDGATREFRARSRSALQASVANFAVG